MTGAAMKGLLRNPLAEPGVIGISGSAAFGAVVAFYSGLSSVFSLALPLGGIAGAILAAVVLYGLVGRGAGTMTLILAGVAINSFAGTVTSLALNLSPNPYAASKSSSGSWVRSWIEACRRFGRFAADDHRLGVTAVVRLGAGRPNARRGQRAKPRVRPLDLRLNFIAGSALAVGSAVAVTGAIGFVGLVVPHILRPFVGARPGRLLLVSGFGGAILLLAADIAVRLLPIRPELKLSVVTAIIGAPFLFSLIYSLRKEA